MQPVDDFLIFYRWKKWLGHAYRKQGIARIIPGCVVPGRRSRGRPRETWVRTMRREAGDECWDDLDELAQDRAWWREFIEALCIPEGSTRTD